MDVLCQAKSGMGKTAVFVLATLQQIEPVDGQVSVLVMCHTRELAFQISKEYERFSKFMSTIKVTILRVGISQSRGPKIPRHMLLCFYTFARISDYVALGCLFWATHLKLIEQIAIN